MMNAIYFMVGTAFACFSVFFGWGGDGYLSKICMFMGGLYFGHLLTEALTTEETK